MFRQWNNIYENNNGESINPFNEGIICGASPISSLRWFDFVAGSIARFRLAALTTKRFFWFAPYISISFARGVSAAEGRTRAAFEGRRAPPLVTESPTFVVEKQKRGIIVDINNPKAIYELPKTT